MHNTLRKNNPFGGNDYNKGFTDWQTDGSRQYGGNGYSSSAASGNFSSRDYSQNSGGGGYGQRDYSERETVATNFPSQRDFGSTNKFGNDFSRDQNLQSNRDFGNREAVGSYSRDFSQNNNNNRFSGGEGRFSRRDENTGGGDGSWAEGRSNFFQSGPTQNRWSDNRNSNVGFQDAPRGNFENDRGARQDMRDRSRHGGRSDFAGNYQNEDRFGGQGREDYSLRRDDLPQQGGNFPSRGNDDYQSKPISRDRFDNQSFQSGSRNSFGDGPSGNNHPRDLFSRGFRQMDNMNQPSGRGGYMERDYPQAEDQSFEFFGYRNEREPLARSSMGDSMRDRMDSDYGRERNLQNRYNRRPWNMLGARVRQDTVADNIPPWKTSLLDEPMGQRLGAPFRSSFEMMDYSSPFDMGDDYPISQRPSYSGRQSGGRSNFVEPLFKRGIKRPLVGPEPRMGRGFGNIGPPSVKRPKIFAKKSLFELLPLKRKGEMTKAEQDLVEFSTLKDGPHMDVVIMNEGTGKRLTSDQASQIQAILLKKIDEMKFGYNVSAKFRFANYFQGRLTIRCATKPSRKWLRTVIPEIEIEGLKLKVALGCDLDKTIRLKFSIPPQLVASDDAPYHILKKLKQQNPRLPSESWYLIHGNKRYDGGSIVIMSISIKEFQALKRSNFTAYYDNYIVCFEVVRKQKPPRLSKKKEDEVKPETTTTTTPTTPPASTGDQE